MYNPKDMVERKNSTDTRRPAHSRGHASSRPRTTTGTRSATSGRYSAQSNNPVDKNRASQGGVFNSAAFRYIVMPLAVGAAFVLIGVIVSCSAGVAVL